MSEKKNNGLSQTELYNFIVLKKIRIIWSDENNVFFAPQNSEASIRTCQTTKQNSLKASMKINNWIFISVFSTCTLKILKPLLKFLWFPYLCAYDYYEVEKKNCNLD